MKSNGNCALQYGQILNKAKRSMYDYSNADHLTLYLIGLEHLLARLNVSMVLGINSTMLNDEDAKQKHIKNIVDGTYKEYVRARAEATLQKLWLPFDDTSKEEETKEAIKNAINHSISSNLFYNKNNLLRRLKDINTSVTNALYLHVEDNDRLSLSFKHSYVNALLFTIVNGKKILILNESWVINRSINAFKNELISTMCTELGLWTSADPVEGQEGKTVDNLNKRPKFLGDNGSVIDNYENFEELLRKAEEKYLEYVNNGRTFYSGLDNVNELRRILDAYLQLKYFDYFIQEHCSETTVIDLDTFGTYCSPYSKEKYLPKIKKEVTMNFNEDSADMGGEDTRRINLLLKAYIETIPYDVNEGTAYLTYKDFNTIMTTVSQNYGNLDALSMLNIIINEMCLNADKESTDTGYTFNSPLFLKIPTALHRATYGLFKELFKLRKDMQQYNFNNCILVLMLANTVKKTKSTSTIATVYDRKKGYRTVRIGEDTTRVNGKIEHSINGVTYEYRGAQILSNVSFQVTNGIPTLVYLEEHEGKILNIIVTITKDGIKTEIKYEGETITNDNIDILPDNAGVSLFLFLKKLYGRCTNMSSVKSLREYLKNYEDTNNSLMRIATISLLTAKLYDGYNETDYTSLLLFVNSKPDVQTIIHYFNPDGKEFIENNVFDVIRLSRLSALLPTKLVDAYNDKVGTFVKSYVRGKNDQIYGRYKLRNILFDRVGLMKRDSMHFSSSIKDAVMDSTLENSNGDIKDITYAKPAEILYSKIFLNFILPWMNNNPDGTDTELYFQPVIYADKKSIYELAVSKREIKATLDLVPTAETLFKDDYDINIDNINAIDVLLNYIRLKYNAPFNIVTYNNSVSEYRNNLKTELLTFLSLNGVTSVADLLHSLNNIIMLMKESGYFVLELHRRDMVKKLDTHELATNKTYDSILNMLKANEELGQIKFKFDQYTRAEKKEFIKLLNDLKITKSSLMDMAAKYDNVEHIEIYDNVDFSYDGETIIEPKSYFDFSQRYRSAESYDAYTRKVQNLTAYILAKKHFKMLLDYTSNNGSVNDMGGITSIMEKYSHQIDPKDNWVDYLTHELISYKIYDLNGVEVKDIDVDSNGTIRNYDVTSEYAMYKILKDPAYSSKYRIELNPLLKLFYALNTVYQDNFMCNISGFPFFHENKTKLKKYVTDRLHDSGIETLDYENKVYRLIKDNTTLTGDSIVEYKGLSYKLSDVIDELVSDCKQIIESEEFTAFTKRQNIPGSNTHPYLQKLENGITEYENYGIIDDETVELFNIQGEKEEAKLFDGGIFTTGCCGKSLSNSVPEIELGNSTRKSLAYFELPGRLFSGQGKWAEFILNNSYVRNSLNNDNRISEHYIDGYRLLKKMMGKQWDKETRKAVINELIKPTLFVNPQYYLDPETDLNYRILGFYYDEVTDVLTVSLEEITYLGEHLGAVTKTVKLDSSFGLYMALGGAYSESLAETDNANVMLNFDESSYDKLFMFYNKIKVNGRLVLKEDEIHHLVPPSAFKNGAGNVNNKEKWFNDESLSYLRLRTDGTGIVFSSEHSTEDSDTSELGLSILMLCEMDNNHVEVLELFRALGDTIFQAMKNSEEYEYYFNAKDELSLMILKNLLAFNFFSAYAQAHVTNTADAAVAYMQAVISLMPSDVEVIKKGLNGEKELRIKPSFDDPKLYNIFFTNFTSLKNRDVIRRRNPGIQAVNTPSESIIKIYDVDIVSNDNTKVQHITLSLSDAHKIASRKKLKDDMGKFLTWKLYAALQDNMYKNSKPYEVKLGDVIEHNDKLYTVRGSDGDWNDKKGTVGIVTILNSDINATYNIIKSAGRNLREELRTMELGKSFNLVSTTKVIQLYLLDGHILLSGYEELCKAGLRYDSIADKIIFIDDTPKSVKLLNNLIRLNEAYQSLKKKYTSYSTQENIIDFNGDAFKFNFKLDKALLYDNLLDELDDIDKDLLIRIPLENRVKDKKPVTVAIAKYTFEPAEIGISSAQSKLFHLQVGDNIGDILMRGPEFFLSRITGGEFSHTIDDFDLAIKSKTHKLIYYINNAKSKEEVIKELLAKDYDFTNLDDAGNIYTKDTSGRSPIGISIIRGKKYRVVDGRILYQIPDGCTVLFMNDADVIIHDNIDSTNTDTSTIKDISVINSKNNYEWALYNSKLILSKSLKVVSIQYLLSDNKSNYDAFKIDSKTNTIGIDLTTEEGKAEYDKLFDLINFEPDQLYKDRANEMFQSFKQYLNMIAARIPTSSMQSFLHVKVAAFIDDGSNTIYMPQKVLWVQGSDYDIDKTFTMLCTINNKGLFQKWSNLFDMSTDKLFEKSMELEYPTGKNGKLGKAGINISLTDKEIAILKKEATTEEDKIDRLDTINNILQRINIELIEKNDYSEITNYEILFQDDNGNLLDNTVAESLLLKINEHNNTFVNESDTDVINDAFKNRVYAIMLKALKNIRNSIWSSNAVNLSLGRTALLMAQGTSDMDLATYNSPAIQAIVLYAEMEGKRGTGIAANGSKLIAVLSYYYNNNIHRYAKDNTLEELTPKVRKQIGDFTKTFQLNKKSTTSYFTGSNLFKNLNLRNLGTISNSLIKEQIAIFVKTSPRMRENAIDILSLLLNLSTDNAKELVLSVIGASTDLMNIYIYCNLAGVDFLDIAKFMVSPEISMLLNKLESNMFILLNSGAKLNDVISYYVNGISPSLYGLSPFLKGLSDTTVQVLQGTTVQGRGWFEQKRRDNVRSIDDISNEIATLLGIGNKKSELYLERLLSNKEDLSDADSDKLMALQKKLVNALLAVVESEKMNNKFDRAVANKTRQEHLKATKARNADFEDEGILEVMDPGEFEVIDEGNGEGIVNLLTIKNKSILFSRYLKDIKNRIDDLLRLREGNASYSDIFGKLKLVRTINNQAFKLSPLTMYLTMNLGMPTTAWDRIHLVELLESTVNRDINNTISKFKGTAEYETYSNRPFTIIDFFSTEPENKNLLDFWIKVLDESDLPINYLDVMRSVPHFFEMWKTFATIENMTYKTSSKAALLNDLVRRLKHDGVIEKIDRRSVTTVERFLTDVTIRKFTANAFRGSNEIVINYRGDLANPSKSNSEQIFNFVNYSEIDEYTRWFENDIMHMMMNIMDADSLNLFLNNITYASISQTDGTYKNRLCPSIDMLIMFESDKTKINDIMKGYGDLRARKFDGTGGLPKVGTVDSNGNFKPYTFEDLLFLYNLFVYKNYLSSYAFTRLFTTNYNRLLVNPEEELNLSIKFDNFEAEMSSTQDFGLNKKDFNIDDLYIRFAKFGIIDNKPGVYFSTDKDTKKRRYYRVTKVNNMYKKIRIELKNTTLGLDASSNNAVYFDVTKTEFAKKLADTIFENNSLVYYVKC